MIPTKAMRPLSGLDSDKRGPCLLWKDAFLNCSEFTISSALHNDLMKKLNSKITGSCMNSDCITYLDIIHKISNNGKDGQVFIIGGAIRDLIHTQSTENIHDIDIKFTVPFRKLRRHLGALYHSIKNEKNDTLIFYNNDETNSFHIAGNGMFGAMIDGKIMTSEYEYDLEAPVNSLAFDANNDIFYDITGNGYQQAGPNGAKQTYQIIKQSDESDDYFNYQQQALWRMLKFAMRDYNVPNETKKKIYNFWYNQSDTIEKKWYGVCWRILNKSDNQRIVERIIDDVTNLNENGMIDFNAIDFINKLIENGVWIYKDEDVTHNVFKDIDELKQFFENEKLIIPPNAGIEGLHGYNGYDFAPTESKPWSKLSCLYIMLIIIFLISVVGFSFLGFSAFLH